MDLDKIRDICVDAAVSFGPNCRAAEALRRNHLRFFSCPFDWMMKYNLDCVFEAIKNKGKGFFADYKQTGEDTKKKFRYMVSKSTGMVSMHHFRKNISVEEAYFVFEYTMNRRFKELDKILSNAKSLCIVTSRKTGEEEITDFIKKFLTLYSFEKLYFINVYNSHEEKITEKAFDNVIIYNCYFKDDHPDGTDPNVNKKFWKGNIEYWDKILSKVSLNKSFSKKYKMHKFINNLISTDLKTKIKINWINFKSRFLNKIRINKNSLMV